MISQSSGGAQTGSVNQWGESVTTEDAVQIYRESEYGQVELWETFSQIDSSDVNSATISADSGETEITMPGGATTKLFLSGLTGLEQHLSVSSTSTGERQYDAC